MHTWITRLAGFLAAVAAFCVAGNPAMADWEFAKWGMTPQQLIAASKGRVKTCTAPGAGGDCATGMVGCTGGANLPGGQDAIGMNFRVVFGFNAAGRLECISLAGPADYASYEKIDSTLRGSFGAPTKMVSRPFRETSWTDTARNNLITVVRLDLGTLVQYRAVGKGL
jgi:hypothetical protein